MSHRGRGRGGGGGTTSTIEVFRPSDHLIPNPDAEVYETENKFIKTATQNTKTATKNLSLSKLSLDAQLPLRPAHGSIGRPIIVYANYLPLQTRDDLSFYQYLVEIAGLGKAPKASKVKTRRLITLLLKQPNFEGVTSDFSSQLVSTRKVAGIPGKFNIAYSGDGEDVAPKNPSLYCLSIRETGTVSPSQLLEDLARADPSTSKYGRQTESIQCFNIVLGQSPQIRPDVAKIGQNKYYPTGSTDAAKLELSPGVIALRGFFKSVRPATSRLLLNVNVSHTVCYDALRLDDLMAKFGTMNGNFLGKQLRLLRVSRTHLNRQAPDGKPLPCIATIWDVATTNDGCNTKHPPKVLKNGAGPRDVQFWLEENRPVSTASGMGKGQGSLAEQDGGKVSEARYISVWDYFTETYQIMMDEKFPVVNTGNRDNPRYLPAEVCRVLPGQPFGKKLDAGQTRNMIRFACRKPFENANSIVKSGRETLGLNPNPIGTLSANGISVGTSLITAPARVLSAPEIYYGKIKVTPRDGSWNMADGTFSTPGTITRWGVFACRRPNHIRVFKTSQEAEARVKEFANRLQKAGITTAGAPAILRRVDLDPLDESPDGRKADEEKLTGCFLGAAASNPPGNLLLFILPSNESFLYNLIKRMGDVTHGCQTICVIEEKFARMPCPEAYLANVALKVNLKMGGDNQRLDKTKLGIIADGKTMVVGIDVTHPSPGSKSTAPSIAGMVASVDANLGQWASDLRIQDSKKEMVTDVGEMLKNRLILWKRSTKNGGFYPRNILIYRDGVSEGQYRIVLDEELPLLRKACQKLYPPKNQPNISIIIVGKRHHTRFFPSAKGDADRSSNCRNGTVVDRGVTDVCEWDFYLQAHTCLQGTARPAHYFVILDEIFRNRRGPINPFQVPKAPHSGNRNAADDLEDLTHNLCHLFGRATKAVSICPPAYYADLLCERARCYVASHFEPGSAKEGDKKPNHEEIQVHEKLKDSMFYI